MLLLSRDKAELGKERYGSVSNAESIVSREQYKGYSLSVYRVSEGNKIVFKVSIFDGLGRELAKVKGDTAEKAMQAGKTSVDYDLNKQ